VLACTVSEIQRDMAANSQFSHTPSLLSCFAPHCIEHFGCAETTTAIGLLSGLDWIVQCFTSPPTQYRLYGRGFLQVKRPNQQYQSTEGTHIVHQ